MAPYALPGSAGGREEHPTGGRHLTAGRGMSRLMDPERSVQHRPQGRDSGRPFFRLFLWPGKNRLAVGGTSPASNKTVVQSPKLLCKPEPPYDQSNRHQPHQIDDHYSLPFGLKKRRRLALVTTVNDDKAMAAPAIIGFSSTLNSG